MAATSRRPVTTPPLAARMSTAAMRAAAEALVAGRPLDAMAVAQLAAWLRATATATELALADSDRSHDEALRWTPSALAATSFSQQLLEDPRARLRLLKRGSA